VLEARDIPETLGRLVHAGPPGSAAIRQNREPGKPPDLDPWQEVLLARDPKRPTGSDFIRRGISLRRLDRDPTITVSINDEWPPAVVIAQNRKASHGRTSADGYRAVRRAVDLAARLGRPIVTLIDTPGADPSASSERQGIAREISATFDALISAPVPTVAVVVGEGGSGGALALAACDVVLIMEHAIFSVIAPEGAASILRRDDVETVARDLHLTSYDLKELGLADRIVAEIPDEPDASIADAWSAISHALMKTAAPTTRRLDRWRVFR
jgi:acetyl-CoA carboxylase alpha subunit